MTRHPEKIERRAVEKLIPYARNSRTHSDAQVAQIAASIKEWGWTTPILIDEAEQVIAGHGRLMAARKLGMAEVPVIVAAGWTDAQKRAYVIADNKLALNAGWDESLLALEFGELEGLGFDVELTGFSAEEIAALTPEQIEPGQTDEDDVPEVPVNPVTVLGDVWILGKHRVMCGDSTSVDAVEKLMAGHKADLCFTSPPYALGKSAALSGNKEISKRGGAYDTHTDDADSWPDLMNGWWSASSSFVNSWIVNVQPLAGNKRELFSWINERIDRLVDVATWDKGHAAPQISKGVMASRFEWVLIFGEIGASRAVPFASWQGTMQSVYAAPPQRSNEYASIHGATMPIHLADWAIGDLSNLSKSIFDPFGGTGTTLISCEKLKKRAFLMELSASYVDVIVNRWQDFTGKKATHAETGQPFAEVSNGNKEAYT